MDDAHRALLAEIRHRLKETKDDPNVTNSDGSNYWGPYVTRAIDERAQDGPALVGYIKHVLRKSDESEGWGALLEGNGLDLSFEDMVLNADEPVRGLFNDEDRAIARQSLGEQQDEIRRRRDEEEAVEVERDRAIVADVAARRRAKGLPWTPTMEADLLRDRAARRRG